MVTLYTRNPRLELMLRNEFQGETVGGFSVKKPAWRDRPKRADYAVTTNMASVRLERFAAGMGTYLIVLPEQKTWLIAKCKLAHYAGKDVTLIGTDYREPNKDGE